MASISKYRDGWRAQVFVKGIRKSKTFRTQREANSWAMIFEHNLKESSKQRDEILGKEDSAKYSGIVSFEDITKSLVKHCLTGVYVLFNIGVCVYVGKSKNALLRIAGHHEKGRKFTHYFVIPCLENELDATEQKYINILCPKENIKK